MGYTGIYAVLGPAALAVFLALLSPGAVGYASLMRFWGLAANMIEERRIHDDLRHGYQWNDEKTVLAWLEDYSVCSFLAHDSALFRIALTLRYDVVVDKMRDHVKALTQDLSTLCSLGGFEIPQGQQHNQLQWRLYLQRVVADSIIAGDVYALESLQRRGEIGDAFPLMPLTILVRAPRDNARLAPWLKRFFRHSPLYEALARSDPQPASGLPPRAI